MLKDSISKIKYLFVLALLFVIPIQANAGNSDVIFIDRSDESYRRQTYFWDLRDRESYLQLTNMSISPITVHVQIFNVNGNVVCEEVDFFDNYTGKDTHVYDVRNLTKNDGGPSPTSDFTDGYGFASITVSTFSEDIAEETRDVLIGMFRVVDAAGYEYRANSASSSGSLGEDAFSVESVLTFNDIGGNNLSDIVGITTQRVEDASDTVYASPFLGNAFGDPGNEVLIFDEFENPQSCSPVIFACAPGQFIYGIDNSLPPSQGGSEICNSSTLNANTAGWLKLDHDRKVCDSAADPGLECEHGNRFVGFIGLNNGDGTGSMDSWWQEGLILQAQ